MAKVTAKDHFVGTPEEVEKYGGQIPADLKKFEKKMIAGGEDQAYSGLITRGTVLEVSDARKQELLKAGVIEGSEEYQKKADAEAQAEKERIAKEFQEAEEAEAKRRAAKEKENAKEKAEADEARAKEEKSRMLANPTHKVQYNEAGKQVANKPVATISTRKGAKKK